jgi:hypothetical protein
VQRVHHREQKDAVFFLFERREDLLRRSALLAQPDGRFDEQTQPDGRRKAVDDEELVPLCEFLWR